MITIVHQFVKFIIIIYLFVIIFNYLFSLASVFDTHVCIEFYVIVNVIFKSRGTIVVEIVCIVVLFAHVHIDAEVIENALFSQHFNFIKWIFRFQAAVVNFGFSAVFLKSFAYFDILPIELVGLDFAFVTSDFIPIVLLYHIQLGNQWLILRFVFDLYFQWLKGYVISDVIFIVKNSENKFFNLKVFDIDIKIFFF